MDQELDRKMAARLGIFDDELKRSRFEPHRVKNLNLSKKRAYNVSRYKLYYN